MVSKSSFAGLKNRYRARTRGKTAPPTEFAFFPPSKRVGDYAKGQALLSHKFTFAGQTIDAAGWSIWKLNKPGPAFKAELHRFVWLDDLAAVGTTRARVQAQEWITEWVKYFGTGKGAGWKPDLTGSRLMQQCLHAEFILDGMPAKAVKTWLGSLGRQADYLASQWKTAPAGLSMFTSLTGLIIADLSLGRSKNLAKTLRSLIKICAQNIDPQGGIASRCPEELMEVFTLMTRTSRALALAGHEQNTALIDTMQRIAPTLRGLRLGDGDLVRDNGGGRGIEGQLDQAFADVILLDRKSGEQNMGFQRMAAGRTLVIANTAAPPEGQPCNSVLGFEMSSGRQKIIVNPAGTTRYNLLDAEAENTADFVTVERAQDLSGVWIVATHNGFAKSRGETVERRLFVASDGRMVSGEDTLSPAKPDQPALSSHRFSVRFHIDDALSCAVVEQAVILTLPNGESWQFQQEGGALTCATKQIMVTGRAVDYTGRIIWSFTRIQDANRRD